MDPPYRELFRDMERDHFWFVSRRRLLHRLIARLGDFRGKCLLDVGCSSGIFLQELHSSGFENLSGTDIDEDSIHQACSLGLFHAEVMDVGSLGFSDNSFDLVIASDVLEHIRDDQNALLELARVMKLNGTLIACVPAFPFLWSHHDVVNMHFRRYTRSGLLRSLRKAGGY